MSKLKFALFGAGFWSNYQLPGWYEAGDVECVAVYNRTRDKAEALAEKFNIPSVYEDAEELLDTENLDFVDICTNVETHAHFTTMAAQHGLAVVCQKPMATTLEEAQSMLDVCKANKVPLYINENWRWQYPIRQFKRLLDSGTIGKPFRARIDYRNSFPVFDNQPFLKELEQFIMTDIGSHILDTARFLFGEASNVYCTTHRIHPDIKGEDVATTMMTMGDGMTVVCEMSYASKREHDRFPETYIQVEGDKGFLELAPDFWVHETSETGTLSNRYVPPRYSWADPAYDLIHSSIVPCQKSLIDALQGLADAENTGEDNLKTIELIFGSYRSAQEKRVIDL